MNKIKMCANIYGVGVWMSYLNYSHSDAKKALNDYRNGTKHSIKDGSVFFHVSGFEDENHAVDNTIMNNSTKNMTKSVLFPIRGLSRGFAYLQCQIVMKTNEP